MCQAQLGKAWSRSGDTAPIVIAPDGGPPEQDGPQPPEGMLRWGCLRESRGCVPQLTEPPAGPGAPGRGEPLLDRILMSNCDYIRALEPLLLTCGPEQSRECCLFMASSADLTLLYCL